MTSDGLRQQYSLALDVTRLADLHLAGRRATGIDRVLQAYAVQYCEQARAVLRWRGSHYVLDAAHSLQLLRWFAHGQCPKALGWWLFLAVVRSWPSRDITGYWLINAGHSGLENSGYAEEMQRMQVLPVIVIQDLIPLTHPEYNRDGEFARHHQRIRTACSCARLLLCISTATKQQLVHYAAQQGWHLPATTVAHLGVPVAMSEYWRRDETDAYFVVISTVEARKNHLMLLQIWRDFIDQGVANPPRLICIGKKGWEAEQTFDLLERCQQLQGVVQHITDCEDTALMHWLTGARALLFPTFAEGFGLPVIEALQHGVPVVLTDLPVFHEFAGTVPEYLPQLDHGAWRQTILDYSQIDHPRRQAQLQRLAAFVAPQWADHFNLLQCNLTTQPDV
jgi:glycosyltransferase involved in cell wall biosynthesis